MALFLMIPTDKDYIAFLESLEKEVEPLPSIETHLEELEAKKDSESTQFQYTISNNYYLLHCQ